MEEPYAILARGPWRRDDVVIRWVAPPAIDDPSIDEAWARAEEEARARGRTLFPGPTAGLARFDAAPRFLRLELHETDYRAFVGTNLAPGYRARGLPCADALGISVIVRTGDEVLLHRRGAGCYEWPLAIDTPGGHLDPRRDFSPFAAALEELESELGILPREVLALSALGLARIVETRKPQVVIAARVTTSIEEVRRRLPHARERFETAELRPVSRDELLPLARSEEELVTPAGRAALVLAAEEFEAV